jgi:hypothetical protein
VLLVWRVCWAVVPSRDNLYFDDDDIILEIAREIKWILVGVV